MPHLQINIIKTTNFKVTYTKEIFIANSLTANCDIMKIEHFQDNQQTTHATNINKLGRGHCIHLNGRFLKVT